MKKLILQKYKTLLLTILILITTLLYGCSKEIEQPGETDASLVENESDTTSELPDKDASAEVNSQTISSLFDFSLYDTDTVFSKEDIQVQEKFETFLHDLFAESYDVSSISLNFLIENPENYGFSYVPSKWTPTDFSQIDSYDSEIDSYMEQLKTFEYTALTYEQQLIYDTLLIYFENEYSFDDVCLFESPFAIDGVPSQLPLIFTEYTFSSKTDVEHYLNLLNTLNDYITKELEYEKYRISKGYYLSNYTFDSVIEQCETFLEECNTSLTTSFSEKLETLKNLTNEEKTAFKEQNSQAIENSVIPAYKNMISSLKEFKKLGTCESGLSSLPFGNEYYTYLLKQYVGTDMTPDELIKIIDKNIMSYHTQMQKLYIKDSSLLEKLTDYEYLYTDASEILNALTKMIETDFPKPVSDNYELKEIDETMADDLSIAFYMLSPIDNFAKNIIYINEERMETDSDLFPTLAHEGIPGHMYQHNYFCSLNPHYFRHLFSFTGYHEAWAKYVELYSYNWSGLDTNVSEALKLEQLFSISLPCRIDLGVNYEGWNCNDIEKYLTTLGLDGKDFAQTYYDTCLSSPLVFFPYYIGYLELMDIQDTIQTKLGENYYVKDFHKFFLEIGPTYFEVIKERIEDWTTIINKQTKNN